MATRTWDNGGGDLIYGTAANWSADTTPTSADDAVIAGAYAIDLDETGRTVLTLDCSGFTGSLSNGTLTLAGVGTSSFGACDLTGLGNGLRFTNAVNHTITGATATFGFVWLIAGTLTLGSNITVDYLEVSTGKTVALATYALICNGLSLDGTSVWTWGAGGKVKFTSVAAYLAIQMAGAPSPNLPPIEVAGSGYADSAFTCETFTLTSGTWNCSGDGTGRNITTVGAMALNGGTLSNPTGRTFTIGGNFSTSRALTGGTWNVTGTAVATGATITGCNFGGGTQLDATSGCTNGGGNTNVNFGAAAPTVTSLSSTTGLPSGLTANRITGADFASVSGVTFGGTAATSIVTVSATVVTCVIPAHAAGSVDVVVTNGDAQTGTLSNGFKYQVAPVRYRRHGIGIGNR